jgi:gas vesicle protein
MDSNRTEYGFATLALAFVIGGLIGTGLGFLFAPQAGIETREKINERGRESREKLRDAVETIQERAKRLAETGKEKFSAVKEKVQESVTQIKEKVSPKKEEGEATEA